MRRVVLLWVVAVSAMAPGCAEEEDRVPVQLSWQLADGRDCAEAGIGGVEVIVTAASAARSTFECSAGLAPNIVDLGAFERGLIEIEVRALSGSGEPLYEGTGRSELRGEASGALIELRFVGADP